MLSANANPAPNFLKIVFDIEKHRKDLMNLWIIQAVIVGLVTVARNQQQLNVDQIVLIVSGLIDPKAEQANANNVKTKKDMDISNFIAAIETYCGLYKYGRDMPNKLHVELVEPATDQIVKMFEEAKKISSVKIIPVSSVPILRVPKPNIIDTSSLQLSINGSTAGNKNISQPKSTQKSEAKKSTQAPKPKESAVKSKAAGNKTSPAESAQVPQHKKSAIKPPARQYSLPESKSAPEPQTIPIMPTKNELLALIIKSEKMSKGLAPLQTKASEKKAPTPRIPSNTDSDVEMEDSRNSTSNGNSGYGYNGSHPTMFHNSNNGTKRSLEGDNNSSNPKSAKQQRVEPQASTDNSSTADTTNVLLQPMRSLY